MLTAHEAPTTYRRRGQNPASTGGVHDGSLPLPAPGAQPSAPHLSRSRGGRAVAPQQLCGEAAGGDLSASVVAGVGRSDAASELSAVLAHAGVLDSAAPQSLASLANHLRLVEFSRGEPIYAAGDAASKLHIVATGAIKLSRRFPDGRTLLTILGPCDVLGIPAVAERDPYVSSATAVTMMRAVSMDAEKLRAAMRRCPEVAELFLRLLARRARRNDDDLTDMTCTDGPGRIAKRVLQLAKWSGMPEGGALRIRHNLTQSELAELTGVSRETVNKTLSKFVNRGWIQLDHQSMLVCEPERLAHRAR
jgi:CRP/FNR family transcriptional regulator, cyclic AMP receptor protein